MNSYLLDTNIASHIIKGDLPIVRERLVQVPMHSVCISVVTEAELLYGVARRGRPAGLDLRVREFIRRVEVLPWTSDAATVYAELRTSCERAGTPLASMDMMIAAHAKSLQLETAPRDDVSVLVTRDRAFSRIADLCRLQIEDWTLP